MDKSGETYLGQIYYYSRWNVVILKITVLVFGLDIGILFF